MTSGHDAIVPWNPNDLVVIPQTATTPEAIVAYGRESLSARDMKSIVAGFDSNSFEMVATFVWTKAAAALKKQLATLGMEFVGEMLNRPDLDDDSDPATAIGDHEAITLAEDLGMVTATQCLRLKHALQLVTHFSKLDPTEGEDDSMQKEEAVTLLRTCIASILGKPRFDAAIQFAEFRKRLCEQSLDADDSDVIAIKNSPYFFVRTTLSVLLSTIKVEKSAALEHSVGNTIVVLPVVWERLRSAEKWQVGQAYAEVNANGNRIASAGLKKALISVRGFDFVPESLRSSTFTEAAARVLSAHFELNNFYNEEAPMKALANLGTSIPMPAFAKCMEATMAVRLGNRWGRSWQAQPFADRVLKSLRPVQWEYYFNEVLPRDRTVLDKLSSEQRPISHWREMIVEFSEQSRNSTNHRVKSLLDASRLSNAADATAGIERWALALRRHLGD